MLNQLQVIFVLTHVHIIFLEVIDIVYHHQQRLVLVHILIMLIRILHHNVIVHVTTIIILQVQKRYVLLQIHVHHHINISYQHHQNNVYHHVVQQDISTTYHLIKHVQIVVLDIFKHHPHKNVLQVVDILVVVMLYQFLEMFVQQVVLII